MERGRRRSAPAIAGLDRRPVGGPKGPTLEVIAEQADVAEVGVDPLAIGDGRGGTRRSSSRAADWAGAAVRFLTPQLAAGLEVVPQHQQRCSAWGSPCVRPEIQALLRRLNVPRADDRREEGAFAQAIGEDQPRPGTSIFHATFSLVLQRSGRSG